MPWKTSNSFDLSPQKERVFGRLDQLPLMNSTESAGTSTPPDAGSISNPSKKFRRRHERKITSLHGQNEDFFFKNPKTQSQNKKSNTPEGPYITTVKVEIPPPNSLEIDKNDLNSSSKSYSPSINYEKNKSVRIVVRGQEASYSSPSNKHTRLIEINNTSRGDESSCDANDSKGTDSVAFTKNEGKSWSVSIPPSIHEEDLHYKDETKGIPIIENWRTSNGIPKKSFLDEPPSLNDSQRSTSTLVTNKSSKLSTTSSNDTQRGIVSLACGVGIVTGAAACVRLPGLLLTYGAGTFLSAYLAAILVIAVPLAYLECGLSQFSNSSVLGVWSLIPLARGIGWSSVIACFYWGAATLGMVAPWLHYIVAQFDADILQGESNGCQTSVNESEYSSLNYYRYCVYNLTSADTMQLDFGLTWTLPAGLISVLVLASISVAGGPVALATVSGISSVLALLGYAMQLILGVSDIAKDGREASISILHLILKLFIPDVQTLTSPPVWLAAVSQALLSLGPGVGLLLNHAAGNNFRFRLKRHLWLLATLALLTTLVVSVTTLIHVAIISRDESMLNCKQGETLLPYKPFTGGPYSEFYITPADCLNEIEVQDMTCSSTSHRPAFLNCEQLQLGIAEGFPYIASSYVLSISKLSYISHSVAYIAVYLGFFGAGVCTACACLNVGVIAARETKSISPVSAAIFLVILLALVAAPMATRAGASLLHALDFYVLLPGITWACAASTIALTLFHGVKKIRKDLTFMLENEVSWIWLPVWAMLLPLLLIGFTVWFIVIEWRDFTFIDGLTWKTATIWMLRSGLLLPMPITAIIVTKSQLAYGLKDKIVSSLQSSREWGEWGPQDPIEHHNWRRWREDETRSYASLDRRLAANARAPTYTHSTLSSTGSSTLNRIRAKYKNGAPSML